jgi:hypothetical protein
LGLGHDPTDGVEGDHAAGEIDADEDEGDPNAALEDETA